MSQNEDRRVWGIHTFDDALFLKRDTIAIGWNEMGDMAGFEPTRDAFKERYMEVFPDEKPGAIAGCAGMVYRFVCEMQEGDYVVFPSKSNRMVNIGVVEGPYQYVPEYETDSPRRYCHQRKVKWLKHFPRTAFSQGCLYELGAAQTLFAVKNYADEILGALEPGFKTSSDRMSDVDDETIGATADEIKQSTIDFILKTLSRNLKGYSLEGFVADLLQSMGYRTTVSKKGGDSGIDIIAYKDELPPRILVQVKSKDGNVNESTLQSLKGAMREGDYGLFVTLSSYTKNAQAYLDQMPIIRGIDGTALAELVLKYYSGMSEKYQKLIPLEMVYIPVPLDE